AVLPCSRFMAMFLPLPLEKGVRPLASNVERLTMYARGVCPPPRSDHAVAQQGCDLALAVARLTQNLLRMLARQRRLALDAAAAVRQPEARADQRHRAVARLNALQDVAMGELRMGHDLGDAPHARAGHVALGEARLPGLVIVRSERRLDDGAQGGIV